MKRKEQKIKRLQRVVSLLGVLNLALVVYAGVLFVQSRQAEEEAASLESTMELLANEIEYQNIKLAEDLVSSIRKEMEEGNNRNSYLIPVAYDIRRRADSLVHNAPASVNHYVMYADSLYGALTNSGQWTFDTVDVESMNQQQQQVHIRLVERGALHFVRGQTVRILSVADTLTSSETPLSLTVQEGEDFTALVQPYWSASGFHPYESYVFRSSMGDIEPVENGNAGKLIIPTRNLLEPMDSSRWVNYSYSVTIRKPYGPSRQVMRKGKFRVVRGCE